MTKYVIFWISTVRGTNLRVRKFLTGKNCKPTFYLTSIFPCTLQRMLFRIMLNGINYDTDKI